MPVKKVHIAEFISLTAENPVIDVRSEAEYQYAHLPEAHNIPLFNNDQRKIIGTLYKQQSREIAIKKGLEFFGPKMRSIVEQTEQITKNHPPKTNHQTSTTNEKPHTVLLYCWRGGMRSGAIAWLLDLYGFDVYQLIGGYKAFRNWVLSQFENDYRFKVLGGYTGSGKTRVLYEFEKLGYKVIDLEKLASHKGSAFGSLGEPDQPSQEMFENKLALKLMETTTIANIADAETSYTWVEDESQRIGPINIPIKIWEQMRKSQLYFLDIEFDQRLNYLVEHYGKFETEKLMTSIVRIRKKLGGLETKNAIAFLVENDMHSCFRILLNYYDKLYSKGLHNRDNLSNLLTQITCETVDAAQNAGKVLKTKVSFHGTNR